MTEPLSSESRNIHCLGDGVPCASDGQGGCVACDDGKGGFMTSKEPCAKTCIYRGGFVECECEPASRRYTDAMAALGEKQAEIMRLRAELEALRAHHARCQRPVEPPAVRANWVCQNCGNKNDASNDHCWTRCGQERPAGEPSPVQSDAGTASQGLRFNTTCGACGRAYPAGYYGPTCDCGEPL